MESCDITGKRAGGICVWLKGVPQGRLSDYADEKDGISRGQRNLCCPDGEKADILRHTALEASVWRCARRSLAQSQTRGCRGWGEAL